MCTNLIVRIALLFRNVRNIALLYRRVGTALVNRRVGIDLVCWGAGVAFLYRIVHIALACTGAGIAHFLSL